MDSQSYSLLKHCSVCVAKCCKKGSPLIKPEEKIALLNRTHKQVFLRYGNHYIVNAEPCPFLINNLCSVQPIKPTVCLAWPINLCFDQSGRYQFIVTTESECAAHNFLRPDFIKGAVKLLSEQSPDFLRSTAELTVKYGFKYELLTDYLEKRNLYQFIEFVVYLQDSINEVPVPARSFTVNV